MEQHHYRARDGQKGHGLVQHERGTVGEELIQGAKDVSSQSEELSLSWFVVGKFSRILRVVIIRIKYRCVELIACRRDQPGELWCSSAFAHRDGEDIRALLSFPGPNGPICRSGLFWCSLVSVISTSGPLSKRRSFGEFILVGPCSSEAMSPLGKS